MAWRDLRSFIAFLEKRGQLKRIKAKVNADLEITEIADRVMKAGGPALLFENVAGAKMPLLINMYGTRERMSWALGAHDLDEVGDRIASLIKLDLPKTMQDKVGKLMEVSELARFGPRTVDSGPCQEVVMQRPSLDGIPVMKCWPLDGGPFITLPVVFTRNPATNTRNVGMYRMQVYDGQTTGMHWHKHKGGAGHFRSLLVKGMRPAGGSIEEVLPAKLDPKLNTKLPVAVALGPCPEITYAASAPLPPEIDEILFAGWLRRKRIELVRCKTVPLEVPAESEIVLEGYVDNAERRIEGPFGDHTGYYSLEDEYPVFHLTCVTHRRNPIYPSTIVGIPPMEDAWLGKATERIFLPLMRIVAPEIVDVNLPVEGVFHNLVLVSIKKTYPGQAKKVMYGLWGMGQMMFAKTIIVFDEHVNVQDWGEVIWRFTNNIDPRRDTVIVDGPLDALDHASPTSHYGSKLGIDATTKLPEEGHPRAWPPDIVMSEEVKALVDRRWKEYGLGGSGEMRGGRS